MGTDIHGGLLRKTWKDETEFIELPPLFGNRDYSFFAILADVRNGYGFANSKRHDPVIPISNEETLFPDHIKSLVDSNDQIDDTWIGDHSYRAISVKTILDTDLHLQETTMFGIFLENDYLKFISGGSDYSYCSRVRGSNIEVLDENDYKIFKDIVNNEGKDLYIQASWKATPFKNKIESLKQWVSCYIDYNNKPEDMYLVIGFDS